MHRFLLIAAAVLLTSGTVSAQKVHADVPFDFYVGNAVMPAGTYDISRCSSVSPVLVVRNCSRPIAVLYMTLPAGTEPNYDGALVFNQYGQKFFLNQVQGLPGQGNLMMLVSDSEKQAQEELGQVRVYEKITVPRQDQRPQ